MKTFIIKHTLKLLVFGLFILLPGTVALAIDTPPEKLRVGFFEFEGYHMMDADGKRKGYGYDLIQLLRPFLVCSYEYVGYNKKLSDMQSMLERGEIDFVTGVVKTPENLNKFEYSSLPVGISSVMMTVCADHCKYLPDDYEHWNGIRVGMLSNSSQNKVFADFAQKKGFTFKPIYFNRASEMGEPLQKGDLDAIVTGSLRKMGSERIYEQLDFQPFYIIVKKGNKALLNQINAALEELVRETPGFSGELQQIYYGHWQQEKMPLSFSNTEKAFIRQAKKSNRTFTVLLQPDQFPLSYMNNGQPCGVFVDIAKNIAQSSGLALDLKMAHDFPEYLKFRSENKFDLLMDIAHNFPLAEESGWILTKPYYPVGISMLFKKRSLRDVHTVGALQGSLLYDLASKNHPKGVTVLPYSSNEAIIKALKSNKIDGGYLLTPMIESVLLNDPAGTMALEPSGRVLDFSIAIRANLDKSFISIIAKSTNNITKQEILTINRKNNLLLDHNLNLRNLVAENPLSISLSLIGLTIFFGLLLTAVLIYYRRAAGASALLAKNSRMWKALLDTMPIHIFAKETASFTHFFCNKERADFFDRSPDQLVNITDYDYLPEEVARRQEEVSKDLVRNPQQFHEQFFQVNNAKGELRDMRVVQKTFSDEDGTTLILGCAIDLTDLENARRQAQENAEWFQKTLISIGDAVLTTDLQGRITLLNHVAEKLLGTTIEDCKGKFHTDYFNIVSYLNNEKVPSPVDHCLLTGEIVSLANHTDLISRNGKRYHIADSSAPIRSRDGKIAGAILVFRDVTEEYDLRDKLKASTVQLKTALEQSQQASSAKGIFLSQMSHEIRTPLNAIIGYLNIARDCGGNPDKINECLNKGIDASSHLLSIINDILDISSIESGKLKIANEDFDFKHLLTGIVTMFYNQAEAKKIKFEMQLRDLTEEWLVGDSLRINQILLNLFSNAIKFTPSGGSVTLLVKQLAIVRNRVQIMFQVSDSGCGMTDEFKNRLFNAFEQQDFSTARKYGGTGLGLSITKNLVNIMGGTIEVNSRENEGTTFTVNLGFERSMKKHIVADADFSHLRALVVDDQQDDRTYIQMVLNKCGVKNDAVDSGEAAVRQIERRLNSRHPYDMCLLDLRLPNMDGIETAKKIRHIKGIMENMPIILVTAYDTVHISNDAHSAGVNKVIQKPLFQSTFFDFLMNSCYKLNTKNDTPKIYEGLKDLSILLVEDNQMNMDITTQYLERAGMKITPAWNGKEAVDLFVNSKPGTFQTILMDIQMPIMDGYQATKMIRTSQHPEANLIPIIAMTANAFNEDIVKALSSGMNDHISKPVFYDQLFASISKLVRKDL